MFAVARCKKKFPVSDLIIMILFLSKIIYHNQRKFVFSARYEFRHVNILTEKKNYLLIKTNQFGTAVLCIPSMHYSKENMFHACFQVTFS